MPTVLKNNRQRDITHLQSDFVLHQDAVLIHCTYVSSIHMLVLNILCVFVRVKENRE